ncbi:MAG: response regulator, partial [Proteobacteria bacterium]
YDLVKTLRGDVQTAGMIIILLTGKREKKDVERGIQAGVDDYCVKPVDPDLFVAKVNGLLAKRFGATTSFPECPISEQADYKFTMRLVGVSEIGMSFQASQPFHVGSKIKVGSDFFAKVGIESPMLRVMSCELTGNEYKINVQYIGMSEQSLQPLRVWIRGRALNKAG